MTFRSVILGLLAAAFIAGVTYYNDYILYLPRMVGSFIPPIVLGGMVLFVLACNPLLSRIRGHWALRPNELAVSLVLACIACSVPTDGLLRSFIPATIMPVHLNRITPGWQKDHVLDYVSPALLVSGDDKDRAAVDDWLTGAGPNQHLSLWDIPWAQWRLPFLAWLPLIGLFAVAIIALALIVHRQWSHHERLRYPIADFVTSLLAQGPGATASVSRNKLFWYGLATVVILHVVNGLHAWYPESIDIPLDFTFPAFTQQWPDSYLAEHLSRFLIVPTAVAFSFFLATDVGLSLGIAQLLYAIAFSVLLKAGINPQTSIMTGGGFSWQIFGSYLGMALALLYNGRRYYLQSLKAAACLRPAAASEGLAAWPVRIFIASVAAMTLWLSGLGLSWPIALMAVVLSLLVYLGISRIVAETGLFWCQAFWFPSAVLIGLFGYEALGPSAVALLCMLNLVLTLNPRVGLMPFLVNGLKITESVSVKPARIGWLSGVTYAAALAVALPVFLWINYSLGIQSDGNNWSWRLMPQEAFDTVARAVTTLKLSDRLDQSVSFTSWQRLMHIQPDASFLWWAGIGLALVPVFVFLRLRWPWWPLHPVIFMIWGGHSIRMLGYSFLLGWAIKVLVTRLGGAKSYHQGKIFMVGIIAGELLSCLVYAIIGGIYRHVTGFMPPHYSILP
ncbi:MAG: DUF6785 family protein [Phycisphaerae bacterium]|jgi:hypothetical protein